MLSSDYDFAVRLGRTEMVGHMIEAAGASIPLEKVVDASGVIVQEKAKYYQGLSVYGKKRNDWADQGRGTRRAPVEGGHPRLRFVWPSKATWSPPSISQEILLYVAIMNWQLRTVTTSVFRSSVKQRARLTTFCQRG